MIIKVNAEGSKVLSDLLDVYLKEKGLQGMQLVQIVSNGTSLITPQEEKEIIAKRQELLHPTAMEKPAMNVKKTPNKK